MPEAYLVGGVRTAASGRTTSPHSWSGRPCDEPRWTAPPSTT